MSVVYDYEVVPDHDPLVGLFERGNALAIESLTPETASIIDAFPFRKWYPLLRYHYQADQHLSPQPARVVSGCCFQTQGSSFQALCHADDSRTL